MKWNVKKEMFYQFPKKHSLAGHEIIQLKNSLLYYDLLWLAGLLMHTVGKLTNLNEEDMFNDNTNIEAMAAKCEVVTTLSQPYWQIWSDEYLCSPQVPEEVRCLLEDLKTKSNGTDEKSALLQ